MTGHPNRPDQPQDIGRDTPEHTADPSRVLLRRGTLYALASGAPAIAALIILPIVARALSPDEFGEVTLALVAISVGGTVLALGLPIAITRHGLVEGTGVPGARGVYLVSLLLPSLVTLTALVQFTLRGTATGLSGILMISLAGAGLWASTLSSQAYSRAVDKPGRVIATAALAHLGGALLGLAVILRIAPSSEAYLVGVLVGYLFAGLLGTQWVLRDGPTAISKEIARQSFRIGMPTMPHALGLLLAPNGLILVAGVVGGLSMTSEFRLALIFGALPTYLVTAMSFAWGPIIYQASGPERGGVLEATAGRLSRLAASCAAVICLTAPWLASWLAPPAYGQEAIARAIPILAAAGVFVVAALSNVHLLIATGRTGSLALTTPISIIVGLTLGLLLGREFGLVGVALGYPTVYALNTVWARAFARRRAPERWSMRSMAIPIVFSTGVAVGCWAFPGAYSVKAILAVAVTVLAIVAADTRSPSVRRSRTGAGGRSIQEN